MTLPCGCSPTSSTPTPSPRSACTTPSKASTTAAGRTTSSGSWRSVATPCSAAYRPDELTDWFATAYVDGFRWVVPTNVVGMSQHADGGLLAAKPYTSGGAYISKMSDDHCGDCAFDPKKRVGDDACPFTAGYWAFSHRHRNLLARNNRTRRTMSTTDRLTDLDAVLEQKSARDRF